MARATGPGRVQVKQKADIVSVLLYNYDVDRADLKVEHMAHLRDHVVTLFQKPKAPFVFLRGMASRTSTALHNLQLSNKRVEIVIGFLKDKGVPPDRLRQVDFVGEGKSKQADGVESDWDRAVLLEITPRAVPPSPDPPPITLPPSTAALQARDLIIGHIRWHHRPPRSFDIPSRAVWNYVNWLIGYRLAMSVYLLSDGTDEQAAQEWRDYALQNGIIATDPTSGGPDGVRQARHVWRDLLSEEARRAVAAQPGLPAPTAREIDGRLLDFVALEESRLGMRTQPRHF